MENQEIGENEEIDLREIWDLFKKNLKLFIISILVTLSIAVIYLYTIPPEYNRTASILIKNDQQGSSIGSNVTENFKDLGLFKTKTNVNDEIDILQTVSYMEEVVKKLNLDYHYGENKFFFKHKSFYKKSPFNVLLDSSLNKNTFSFKIKFLSPKEYKLTNFKFYEIGEKPEKFDIDEKLLTGNNIKTPHGELSISTTSFFTENHSLGRTYTFSKSTVKSTAKKCRETMIIALKNKKNNVITLDYKDTKPERANDILNTLISIYNKKWIKDKNTITLNTSSFINERLRVIEKELGNVDNHLSKFKNENSKQDVENITKENVAQIVKNKNTQIKLNNQLSRALYLQDYLKDNTKKDELIPDNTGLNQPQINSLIDKYNNLILQKNIIVSNSSINSPLVSEIIINLKSIKQVITNSINELINTVQYQIVDLKREKLKSDKNNGLNSNQSTVILSIERQQKIKEELYLFLLQQRESNQLSLAFTEYKTEILSLSDGSPTPISPKKPLILVLAIIIGIIIPAAYIYIQIFFDTLIHNKKDIKTLNIPYLGSIPLLDKNQIKEVSKSISGSNSRNKVSEAFRIIRTNLDFIIKPKENANIIQAISINTGSGKSFFTFNIALSMVLKGSKVLIIDVDMRKATLSKKYFKNIETGLSQYLSGKETNIDNIIKHSELTDNLDIIPVGAIPPNPSELLLTEKLSTLIEQMKKKYDYIFLDSTPVEIVPDAAIVGKYCDTTIFIIRAELLDKRMLPEIKELYDTNRYNNMCILLNSVKNNRNNHYYYNDYQEDTSNN